MRLPHLSIGHALFIVFLLSIDLAWLRAVLPHYKSPLGFKIAALDAGVVPMANLNALGLYLLLNRRERSRPFVLGFTIAGAGTMIAFVIAARAMPRQIVRRGRTVYVFVEGIVGPIPTLGRHGSDILTFVNELIVGAVMLSLPQLILALLGGVLAWIIQRRTAIRAENRVPPDPLKTVQGMGDST